MPNGGHGLPQEAPPETTVTNKLVSLLEAKGYFVYHPPNTPLGKGGWPDLWLCHRGRLILIELKLPGQFPTSRQKLRHQQARNAGAVMQVFTVPPVGKAEPMRAAQLLAQRIRRLINAVNTEIDT